MAMEFALLSIPFFMFLLFILEISYDLYTQAALDAGLHLAVRSVQTGNAQNISNGNNFVTQYLCPSLNGLLECGTSIYVKVQRIDLNTTDFYGATTGQLPVTGNTLNLSGFGSTDFCNSAPNQAILVTAIYLGPTFIGGLLPKLLSVMGPNGLTHATLATTGLVTEEYTPAAAAPGTTPAKQCS